MEDSDYNESIDAQRNRHQPWRAEYMEMLDDELRDQYRNAEVSFVRAHFLDGYTPRRRSWASRWLESELFWRDVVAQALGGLTAVAIAGIAAFSVGLIGGHLLAQVIGLIVAWLVALIAGLFAGTLTTVLIPGQQLIDPHEDTWVLHPELRPDPKLLPLRVKALGALATAVGLAAGILACGGVGVGLTLLVNWIITLA